MLMSLALGLIIAAVANGAITVFPASVAVKSGEGLVLQVLPPSGPLKTCLVSFGGYTVALAPEEDSSAYGVSYWGRGLDQGDCGVQVPQFNSTAHAGTWLFVLANTTNATWSAKSTVTIAAADLIQPITLVTEMGKELIIPCGDEKSYYCLLSNPSGETIRSGNNCTATIPNVKMSDVGIWVCAQGLPTSIEEQATPINVSVHTSRSLDIGHNETEKEVIVYCNNLAKNITYCRFERPDGKAWVMMDGRTSDRYTYFGRGIANNECGMSIQKPLKAEDLGTWMCTLGLKEGGRSGGFVTVGTTALKRKSVKTGTKRSLFVLTGSSLTLDCAVNTALNYCWFKHPNGTRFNPHPDAGATSWQYHGDGLQLGQCGITLFEANVLDTGTWTCGMGVQGETEASKDQQESFDVAVAEMNFIENQTITKAMVGDVATLACHSLQGEAIQYCSFLAPNGTGYNLLPGQGQGRFTYHGAGLEYGNCGIVINPVQNEDYGIWQCGAMLAASTDGRELVRNLNLTSPSFLSSSALGLLIGVLAAATLVVGFVFYRRRRTQQRRMDQGNRPVTLSMLSEGSDDVQIHPGNRP